MRIRILMHYIILQFLSLCLLLLYLLTPAIASQDDPNPQFEVQVDIVSIDVEVLDDAGNPVKNLDKEDFLVKEDGKQVEITNFAVLHDRPISLAILLDTSTIKQEKLTIAKRFITHIIHLLDHKDDICFYSFDKRKVYLESDFSTDRVPIIRALENIIERSIILERGPQLVHVDLPTRIHRKSGENTLLTFNEEYPLEVVREQAIDIVEKEYMKRILRRYHGSIKRAAEHAGLTTRSIHGKMKKFNLRKEDYKN